MFSWEFCEISKNTYSNRTPPVAAADIWQIVFTQGTGNRWSLCKKRLYKGLSVNSCSMDVSAIKNNSSKQQIRSKIPTISEVQVFHFLGFFLNIRSTWECLSFFFFFFFFDCNVLSKNLLSLFLQKIRWPVLFACKLITFTGNWSITLQRETAVDIALEVSENSHGNLYSEVLNKIVACQFGVY